MYVLNDWITFVYDGPGERPFKKGTCILQTAGIVHNDLDWADDPEILEACSPAMHETVVLARALEAAAAR